MRDYACEFQAYLSKHLPQGDYVLPIVSAEIVEGLRATDPDLLAGWLAVNAQRFVGVYVGSVERSARARQASDAPRRAFAIAAESDDREALTTFGIHFVVNDGNLRRRLGDMTKADHLYVAERHTDRANAGLFEAAFHKAIARRIPAGKTTSEVLTEDAYAQLRKTIHAQQETAA